MLKRLLIILFVIFSVFLVKLVFFNQTATAPVAEVPAVKNNFSANEVYKPVAVGYLTNSSASIDSFKKNNQFIDVVIGDWLHLNKGEVTEASVSLKDAQDGFKGKKIAMVNNYAGGWQTEQFNKELLDSQIRKKAIDDLLDFIVRNKLDGLSVDFEKLPVQSREAMLNMLSELKVRLNAQNLELWTHLDVPEIGKYAEDLAKVSDRVIVMFYDQHQTTTEAGPIAGAAWFVENISEASKYIPNSKLIVGMGNYAYQWSEQGVKGLSYSQAKSLAQTHKANFVFDSTEQNSYFKFNLGTAENIVWILDSQSVKAQIQLSKQYQPYGYAIFRFGSEDQQSWQQLKK